VRRVEPGTVDASDFLPKTTRDIEQMWTRLREILSGIRDPDLSVLIARFLDNEIFANRFRQAPAARNLHHAFIGGLLEHTLNLLELALVVLPRYPEVSPDLVLAGILFHDSGKTAELSYEKSFDYTDEGQLVGHIVQAVTWIHEAARAIERDTGRRFPEGVLLALKHIIIAHHGRYEYGSPKLPATAEAFVVHYLDNLDAKLTMVFSAIENDPDEVGVWTNWIPALETKLFKPDVMNRTPRAADGA
jgi:3'-5' exoribonuclease